MLLACPLGVFTHADEFPPGCKQRNSDTSNIEHVMSNCIASLAQAEIENMSEAKTLRSLQGHFGRHGVTNI